VSTINEIAKRANVSIGTVDRVIHNRGRVSKETEKKIRKIIEELNYKPNILARSLSLSRIFHFGVLMPKISPENQYWEIAVRGIDKAQSELKIHKVKITYFQYVGYSERSFKRESNKVLKENLDGLLFAPTIYKTIDSEFIEKIPPNLPFIFFNSKIPNTNCLAYIGQDSFQSGVLSAKLMQMLVKQKGTIAIITIFPDDYHINERAKGFKSFFKGNKDIETKIYGPDRSEDKRAFERISKTIVSENENLQGIFVTTALTYRVAEFIKSQGLKRKIFLIGYDLTERNIKYLKEGIIDFLISQKPEIQGYQGIYTLYKHVVLKEKVEAKIMMPLDIVTKENIDYYDIAKF